MLRSRHSAILLGPALVLASVLTLSQAPPPASASVPACSIVVNSANDNVTVDGVVTLREAISYATDVLEPGALEVDQISGCPGDDDNPGAARVDTITFDMTVFPPGEGTTIPLDDSLPELSTGNDTVNGDRAGVIVDGGDDSFVCFHISSDLNTIAKMKVANCSIGIGVGDAISLEGGPAFPAGVAPPVGRNLIVGNTVTNGVVGVLLGASSEDNTVAGNRIGTNATAEVAAANVVGILVNNGDGNQIGPQKLLPVSTQGSPLPTDEGNIISGNSGDGIRVEFSSFEHIEGNIIGLNNEGREALPNGRHGIHVRNSVNIFVGGAAPGLGNVISGNDDDGIHIEDQVVIPVGEPQGFVVAVPVIVMGNLIGPNSANDEAIGNGGDGVRVVDVGANRIGGSNPGEGNVIAGNAGGIRLAGEEASRNAIEGNFIGTNAAGAPSFGNLTGVEIVNAPENVLGGDDEGEENVIAGNLANGVFITGPAAIDNRIVGNHIGVMPDGQTAVPNATHGVRVVSAGTNVIGGPTASEGNHIAHNGGDGVAIEAPGGAVSTRKAILSNSIHTNGGLGIDLENDGVTLNDPDDGDGGANAWQNYPLIQTAEALGGGTHVIGTLNSAPDTGFRVQFFSNITCDPSGNGEGQRFLGEVVATTEGDGDAVFDVVLAPVAAGFFVTATATDPLDNTSEFSQCEEVTGATMRIWGDLDCDEDVDEMDALKGLLHSGEHEVEQEPGCPEPGQSVLVDGNDGQWGNWDCDGETGPLDSLAALMFVADLAPDATGCPGLGTFVEIEVVT